MSSRQIQPKCNKVNNPTVLSGWHAPRTQRVPARLPDRPSYRSFVRRSAFMTGATKTRTKKGRGKRRGKRHL